MSLQNYRHSLACSLSACGRWPIVRGAWKTAQNESAPNSIPLTMAIPTRCYKPCMTRDSSPATKRTASGIWKSGHSRNTSGSQARKPKPVVKCLPPNPTPQRTGSHRETSGKHRGNIGERFFFHQCPGRERKGRERERKGRRSGASAFRIAATATASVTATIAINA